MDNEMIADHLDAQEDAAGQAPEVLDAGQADGSPPPETDQTSADADEGAVKSGGDEAAKELRRKITEQAEELKTAQGARDKLLSLVSRVTQHPDYPTKIKPFLEGRAPEDDSLAKEYEELAVALAGEENAPKLKRAFQLVAQGAVERARTEWSPFATSIRNTEHGRARARGLQSEGLSPDAWEADTAFKSFREDYARKNEWFNGFSKEKPEEAASVVASLFVATKQAGGDRAGGVRNASLEKRGGPTGAAAAASSSVELRPGASIEEIFAVTSRGLTPVFAKK